MKKHVLKRHILNNWRRRWVRLSSTVIVLGVAIGGQYFVSRLPQSQDVEDAKYTPATSKVSQQEIVIHGPILFSDSNILLKFDGRSHETVEFRATKARLTSDTLSFLQNIVRGHQSGPPVGIEEIDYLIKNDQEAVADKTPTAITGRRPSDQSAETGTCLTFIAVRTIAQKLPNDIHFYQPEIGNSTFQAVVISATGADLEIQIHQAQPDTKKQEGNPWSAGCRRNLSIGKKWGLLNNGEFDLSFIVPANTAFRFDFHALGPTSSLRSGDGLFEPFDLGETLKAKALSVIPYEGTSLPASRPPRAHFSVQGSGDTGLLNINGLREASGELQLSFSGIGLVELNGKPTKTLSLFDLINRYPIIATIFGIANAALAGWVLHTILGRNSAS